MPDLHAPSGPSRLRFLRLFPLLLALAGLTGCQQEEIERYQVARLPEPKAPIGPFNYDMPAGWRVGPPAPLSKLTLETGEGADITRLTVTPLSGAAGGLASNINRWRGQIGLAEIPADQLLKDIPAREVGGRAGKYVELLGKEKAILGAILPDARETLFIKFMGPLEVVKANKDNFDKFLNSVKFDAGGGANDGK